jgi:Peptidase family M50
MYLLVAVVLVGVWAAVVIHEIGHLVVALAIGAKVRGFRVGAKDSAFQVDLGKFHLVIGSPSHGGAVHYEAMPSVWKRASITLAGPLTDLMVAGVVLAVRLPVKPPITHAFAAAFVLVGLRNLVPTRTRTGRLSDGARLLAVRADVRAQRMGAELLKFNRGGSRGTGDAGGDQGSDQVKRILAAYRKGDLGTRTSVGRVARTLAKEGRIAELMELHRGLGGSPELMSVAESTALASMTNAVSFLSEPSRDDAELAERRLDALLRYHDLDRGAEVLVHTGLAMLLLRRGQYADVERLCRSALAYKELPPPIRENVLAMVIVARQELRQSYADVYAEAVALDRDADKAVLAIRLMTGAGAAKSLLAELKEFEANPNGPVQPERTNRLLAAYRDGGLMAMVVRSVIGRMLRDEGRIAELLEIHDGIPLPSGKQAVQLMQAMAALEDVVASVPGLPAEVYELAATRVQWLLDNYPFEGTDVTLH